LTSGWWSTKKVVLLTIENEQNSQINFLDITITRLYNSFQFGIYRKNTSTDIMIHHNSCHPIEHKMSGINYLINRLATYPLTNQNRSRESQIINHLLDVNGYKHLKTEQLVRKKDRHTPKENNNQKHKNGQSLRTSGKKLNL
jgi:hypothetical protein